MSGVKPYFSFSCASGGLSKVHIPSSAFAGTSKGARLSKNSKLDRAHSARDSRHARTSHRVPFVVPNSSFDVYLKVTAHPNCVL